MPKISVITVNYNNAEGLARTITSVLEQDLQDVEYIVVDGASTDGSLEVISNFEDKLDLWHSAPDTGVYQAMNRGIDRAQGEYILFLNSGDQFNSKDILQSVLPKLRSAAIYYGDLMFVSGQQEYRRVYPEKVDFRYFMTRSLPHPGSFIPRSLFDSIFRYSEQYQIVSDWEFFLYAVLKEEVCYQHLDMVVSNFELDGMSNDPANKALIEAEKAVVIRHRFPDRVLEYEQWIKEQAKPVPTQNHGMLSSLKRQLKRLMK